jgi:hypothetical protein
MATTLKVKYFNSFWLKKTAPLGMNYAWPDTTTSTNNPFPGFWPGLPWTPTRISPDTGVAITYPAFPWYNYPGIGYTPGVDDLPPPIFTAAVHWYVEEASYKGGFNNNRVNLGVRAYTVDDNPIGQFRERSLIHSGILNTRTGFNQTNVFSVSDNIERDLEAINGSIQKLYSEDTNIIVFQEAKVARVLINKNALYSGTQGSQDTANIRFLGQIDAFAGQYGISKNPESFAYYGYRKYFTDKDRGVVCRLSMDGITEISEYGMSDWFRDNLALISDLPKQATVRIRNIVNPNGQGYQLTFPYTSGCLIPIGALTNLGTNTYITNVEDDGANNITVTFDQEIDFDLLPEEIELILTVYQKDRIPAGWDIYNKNYTLSLQYPNSTLNFGGGDVGEQGRNEWDYYTVNFDETVRGWVSFYSYRPLWLHSLKNYYYTLKGTQAWQHYDPTTGFTPFDSNNYGKFYGATTPAEANITFIFNPNPSITKNFKTISYEGSNGWMAESILSDYQEFDFGGAITQDSYRDSAQTIFSLNEGTYVDAQGYPVNAGFTLKENRYCADIISSSTTRPSQVLYTNTLNNYPTGGINTGVKGYVVNVKLKTDTTTDVGGRKELFTSSSEYVVSST